MFNCQPAHSLPFCLEVYALGSFIKMLHQGLNFLLFAIFAHTNFYISNKCEGD